MSGQFGVILGLSVRTFIHSVRCHSLCGGSSEAVLSFIIPFLLLVRVFSAVPWLLDARQETTRSGPTSTFEGDPSILVLTFTVSSVVFYVATAVLYIS